MTALQLAYKLTQMVDSFMQLISGFSHIYDMSLKLYSLLSKDEIDGALPVLLHRNPGPLVYLTVTADGASFIDRESFF